MRMWVLLLRLRWLQNSSKISSSVFPPLWHSTTSNGKVAKPVSGKTYQLAFEFSKTKLAKKCSQLQKLIFKLRFANFLTGDSLLLAALPFLFLALILKNSVTKKTIVEWINCFAVSRLKPNVEVVFLEVKHHLKSVSYWGSYNQCFSAHCSLCSMCLIKFPKSENLFPFRWREKKPVGHCPAKNKFLVLTCSSSSQQGRKILSVIFFLF